MTAEQSRAPRQPVAPQQPTTLAEHLVRVEQLTAGTEEVASRYPGGSWRVSYRSESPSGDTILYTASGGGANPQEK